MLGIKLLLLPFSILYGFITQIRNQMFSRGLLKSEKFNLPVIAVGNLTTGGSGKTPHIEYLIRLLGHKKTATLSRGYKRKTKGFKFAIESSTADLIGDEPMQFFSKFKKVMVAVDEDRCNGIRELLKINPELEAILLDDAYQHQYVQPSLNILLIEYSTVGETDFLLPSGNLRESKKNTDRADIIVISKCPSILSPIEKRRVLEGIEHNFDQKIFFSYIEFQTLVPVTKPAEQLFTPSFKLSEHKVIGLTGIANNSTFIDHLDRYSKQVQFLSFQDHHNYSITDMVKLENQLKGFANKNKIIITTEKDYVKLQHEKLNPIIQNLPIFVLPIVIKFHDNQEVNEFDNYILNHVK